MSRSKTTPEQHPKPMLGELIRIHRNLHRYGLRGMGKQIGISHATLARVENGKSVDGHTIIKLFHWLFGGAGMTETTLPKGRKLFIALASSIISKPINGFIYGPGAIVAWRLFHG